MRTNDEVMVEIERLIINQIQPSVDQHGGVVSLQSFDNGVATMFMSGACSGCASSALTLKMGIEKLLTHHIAEVKSVEGVDDQHSEAAPYYS